MSPKSAGEESISLREVQTFLDRVVHDLRAPLRGIGTSASLLSQKIERQFDAEAKALLESLHLGVAALNRLALALAEYSQSLVPQKTESGPLPVANAARVAIAGLQDGIEKADASVYVGRLPQLSADHAQLGVLFRNLLNNALEYRRKEVPPRIEVTATSAGDEWRFSVSDNGTGIPSKYQRQIFEPFEKLHQNKGAPGLGLAICKRIVEGHGGRLWVNSVEGEGSTFFFTMPASPA